MPTTDIILTQIYIFPRIVEMSYKHSIEYFFIIYLVKDTEIFFGS